jgi:hypothetical protein
MGMKKSNALGMMMMMGAMFSDNSYGESINELTDKGIKPKQVKKIIPKGVKKFLYDEIVIYAINKKNADRKAKNKGLIL